MSKTEYISQLKAKLSKLPREEVENAVLYYTEYFDDAGNQNEDEIIKELGSPSKVASQIIGNYAINDRGTSKTSVKKGLSTLWIVILAIFASPITLPIAVAAVALAFSVVVVIISFVFAFAVATVACIGSGGFIIFAGIRTFIMSFDFATFIYFVGMGLVAISIGLLFGELTIFLAKKSFTLIVEVLGKFLLRRNLA